MRESYSKQIGRGWESFGILEARSFSTKLMYYRPCVQNILLYGDQIWYPISYRRKMELVTKDCVFWVTGFPNFSQQLAASIKERMKERKKELIISETHQKYYDLNTNNKKEQSIRFGSGSVHL